MTTNSYPADILRAAADRLDRLVAEAVVDGPWEYREATDRDTYPWTVYAPKAKYTAGTGFCPGTARYIATMDPVLGRALATAFRAAAPSDPMLLLAAAQAVLDGAE